MEIYINSLMSSTVESLIKISWYSLGIIIFVTVWFNSGSEQDTVGISSCVSLVSFVDEHPPPPSLFCFVVFFNLFV